DYTAVTLEKAVNDVNGLESLAADGQLNPSELPRLNVHNTLVSGQIEGPALPPKLPPPPSGSHPPLPSAPIFTPTITNVVTLGMLNNKDTVLVMGDRLDTTKNWAMDCGDGNVKPVVVELVDTRVVLTIPPNYLDRSCTLSATGIPSGKSFTF